MSLHPPCSATLDHVRRLLGSFAYRFTNEKDLQHSIEQVLDQSSLSFSREAQLGDLGIVDFMVENGVAVEVKVGGSLAAVTRQLHRYAQHDAVSAILLVSTLNRLNRQPQTLNEKPVAVLVLAGGLA